MEYAKPRLAVVMFTDIVGYSALSHRKEGLALELLDEHRKIIRPILTRYRGKEIKTIGDAFLVQFGSAIEATECAVDLQAALASRNDEEPEERRILVRIGIHLGDIVLSDGDVYGDGVNIAARLLHHSTPGGICISQQVYDQVHGKLPYAIQKLGSKRLKNIAKRVQSYSVDIHRIRKPLSRFTTQAKKWAPIGASLVCAVALIGVARTFFAPTVESFNSAMRETYIEKRRIAVLPFRFLGANAEDGFLSEGICDELISALSNVSSLRVLAPTSTLPYEQTSKSLKQIGRELAAGTLVDGSIQRQGDRLRVSVRITDAKTQETLWSKDFDGSIKDAFTLQRRIASQIGDRFKGRTLASVAPRSAEDETPVPQSAAYLAYLKGRYLLNRRQNESITKAVQSFEQAVQADPHFAPAYAALANAYGIQAFYGYLDPAEASRKSEPYIDRALQLDPELPEALLARAAEQAYYQYDWRGADASFRQMIERKPGFSLAHQWYGEFLASIGREREARRELRFALELDPLSLSANTAAGQVDFFSRNYGRAAAAYRGALELDPNFVPARYWLGRTLIQQKNYNEAILELEKAKASDPASWTLSALAQAYGLSGQAEKAREILDQLKQRAQTQYVSAYELAVAHWALGDREAALGALESSFREHSKRLVQLSVDPVWDSLRKDPRFVALTKQFEP